VLYESELGCGKIPSGSLSVFIISYSALRTIHLLKDFAPLLNNAALSSYSPNIPNITNTNESINYFAFLILVSKLKLYELHVVNDGELHLKIIVSYISTFKCLY
jgi:hypothetical protein